MKITVLILVVCRCGTTLSIQSTATLTAAHDLYPLPPPTGRKYVLHFETEWDPFISEQYFHQIREIQVF